MQRHLNFWALAATILLLTGCQTLGIPQATTFKERLAAGYTTCAGVRATARVLLTSDVITEKDAAQVQGQVDNFRLGLDVAKELHAGSPAASEDKLTAVLAGLNALNQYLLTRGK